MTTKKLTKYQACQTEFLSEFNFVISYIPGKENQKADLLTQCPNNLSLDINDDCKQYLLQTILPTKRLNIILIETKNNNTIIDQIV